MQLVLLAQDYPPQRGGIQTYSWELARRWARQSRDFCVIAPQQVGASAFDADHEVLVHRVAGGGDAFFAAAATRLLSLPGRPATFHSQWPSASGAECLRGVGRLGRVFVAAHGRELLIRPWRKLPPLQRGYDAFRREVLRRADKVFAVSDYTRGLARELGVPQARIAVYPNGTDPDVFSPGESNLRVEYGLQDALVFLSVARLVPRKGIDQTLQAMQGLRRNCPSARLVVVGEGPERARLGAQAQVLGIGEQVLFVGGVNPRRLIEWYRAADVFVLPARSEPPDVEGFGIVYLEAGACGLPVIGPDVGGPTSAIVDGETGYCVPPTDHDALTAAMLRLAKDPSLRARLGGAGRRRVLAYANWDRTADALWSAMHEAS